MKHENGRSRLFGLKYTHIIRHRSHEGKVYDYLAANVKRTGTHIVYESENAWGGISVTRVAYENILDIKEIKEGEKV
ncbi:MAG: hypothetical protein IJD51_01710 [Clostridia bacterium]|nr:hypothetical protein [Clostridia bacterium]